MRGRGCAIRDTRWRMRGHNYRSLLKVWLRFHVPGTPIPNPSPSNPSNSPPLDSVGGLPPRFWTLIMMGLARWSSLRIHLGSYNPARSAYDRHCNTGYIDGSNLPRGGNFHIPRARPLLP